MKLIRRSLAALELLLVFPAVLFLAAVFTRSIQPQQYEPARTAQQIVDWYAARPQVGLWLLLIALPLTVLVVGLLALRREWHHDPALRAATCEVLHTCRSHAPALSIAFATTLSAIILGIVAFHMLTN